MGLPSVKKPVRNLVAAQTTPSGTNSDTFGRAVVNHGHRGLLLFVPRTADTGICTLDVFLQGLLPGGDETNNAHWFDVAPAVVAQFADGETGTYGATIYPGVVTAATVTTTGAKHNTTNAYLPQTYRLRLRNGGTAVTNTIGEIAGFELP